MCEVFGMTSEGWKRGACSFDLSLASQNPMNKRIECRVSPGSIVGASAPGQ